MNHLSWHASPSPFWCLLSIVSSKACGDDIHVAVGKDSEIIVKCFLFKHLFVCLVKLRLRVPETSLRYVRGRQGLKSGFLSTSEGCCLVLSPPL